MLRKYQTYCVNAEYLKVIAQSAVFCGWWGAKILRKANKICVSFYKNCANVLLWFTLIINVLIEKMLLNNSSKMQDERSGKKHKTVLLNIYYGLF